MASTTSIINSAASLVEIGNPIRDEDWATTIIVVPDIGNPHSAQHWSDGTSCWLCTLLPTLVTGPRVFEFQYSQGAGQDFSWDQLIHCGDNLLDNWLSHCSDPMFARRPLIFIGHGLGGMVTKRAIGALYKNFYEPSFGSLLRCLAGVVFLGSPHPTFEKPHEWPKLPLLLKASTKLSKKVIDRNAAQLSTTARISQLFQDSGIEAPVLSVFGGKATKTSSKFISSKRETLTPEMLVDASFARTGVKHELLIKADTEHSNLCNFPPSSSLLRDLEAFFALVKESIAHLDLPPAIEETRSVAGWTATASEAPDWGGKRLPKVVVQSTVTLTLMLEVLFPMGTQQPSTNTTTAGWSSNVSNFDVVPLKDGIEGVARSFNLPLHFFKPHTRNPEFFGRHDILQSLQEGLVPSNDSAGPGSSPTMKTFALCGAGGLGKTQLAVEFAFANKGSFDAIFVLQASDTEKLAQSFAEISVALGLESPESAGDQIVSKNLVLGWLSEPARHIHEGARPPDDESIDVPSWLLIFDNADDLNVLRDFWPESACGSTLVTSRDPLAKTRTHVPIANGVNLPPFTPEEAGQLLRRLTGYAGTTDIAPSESIARKLSGLPLALTQIAGTIGRRELSFDEFLELYNQESLRSEFHRSNILSEGKTLYTVWAFEDLSPGALSLLNIIAFLDPDQVPESLLIKMESLDPEDRPEAYPVSVGSFMEARSELSKSSLIKRNRERKVLIIHRIIQDAARLRMEPLVLQEHFTAVTHLLYLAWPFSEFEHSTARWRICEPIVPHVGNFLRLYEESEPLKVFKGVIPKMARLFMDFGWYHIERGNLNESRPYFASCQRLCAIEPDSTQITCGDNEGCMAQLANLLNDYQAAISHAAKSVKIFEEHDKDGWRLPQAYNELSEAYIAARRWEEAAEQADLAIKGYFALPEDDYPDWAMMNKAYSLCQIGRLEEASAVLEEYLDYREQTFGPMDSESFKTGQGMYFLGKVRYSQGRLPESLDLHLKALAQYHSSIGPKHFRVAALYHKVGEVYTALDQLDEACLMFSKAVTIFNDKPEYAAQIARTLHALSLIQAQLNMEDEAAVNLKEYNECMKKLAKKHRRKITYDGLKELIRNNWD